ncbi:EAL domain-containing protein, partial [Staphylococcus aureus]|uniref:EAL domain-containing protein n=1 Tax=Staphylococcus aureus TaxID=1280 RepID=UPI0010235A9F
AMSQGEFTVHYQPIVSRKSGRPVAVEALARWKHQHLGLMLPDQFILAAEQTGMIVPLGQLVLEEACRAVARWRRRGKRLRLGINLSPRELWQQDLPERVVGTLK